jgi:hypothetical protein
VSRISTEAKPRWADCTARESVWESWSLPALIKAIERNLDFLIAISFCGRFFANPSRQKSTEKLVPQNQPEMINLRRY